MTRYAAILAAATCLLIGWAIGVNRPCPVAADTGWRDIERVDSV